jgi:hypothetical protein
LSVENAAFSYVLLPVWAMLLRNVLDGVEAWLAWWLRSREANRHTLDGSREGK